MGPLRAAPLGFQQITALTAAVGLTLPVGAQQAQASSCSLSGRLLTVGGTVTGAFAPGQVVQGTGIPANTAIVSPGGVGTGTWNLSNACTTETGEEVTAYSPTYPDFALIRATGGNVYWRDDGVAPTATVGMPLLTTDVQPWEYWGDLSAIQFVQVATAVLDVSYYRIGG